MRPRPRGSGFTIIEVVVSSAVLVVLTASAAPAFLAIQDAYMENQLLSNMTGRAQHSMERLIGVSSQALTSDPGFATLYDGPDDGFHGVQFRLIDSFNNGAAVYNDSTQVFVLGPDEQIPCEGILIGRGANIAEVVSDGAGKDRTLGTRDDLTSVLKDGVPVVELLLPNNYAPSEGEMLNIDVNGQRLTITLRLNVQHKGEFVLDDDLVIVERVALQQ